MEENKKDILLLTWQIKYKHLDKMKIILGEYNLPTTYVCYHKKILTLLKNR